MLLLWRLLKKPRWSKDFTSPRGQGRVPPPSTHTHTSFWRLILLCPPPSPCSRPIGLCLCERRRLVNALVSHSADEVKKNKQRLCGGWGGVGSFGGGGGGGGVPSMLIGRTNGCCWGSTVERDWSQRRCRRCCRGSGCFTAVTATSGLCFPRRHVFISLGLATPAPLLCLHLSFLPTHATASGQTPPPSSFFFVAEIPNFFWLSRSSCLSS